MLIFIFKRKLLAIVCGYALTGDWVRVITHHICSQSAALLCAEGTTSLGIPEVQQKPSNWSLSKVQSTISLRGL